MRSEIVELSTFRLYLMRAAYLLIAVGLAGMIWPRIVAPPADMEHMRGVVHALLGTVGLLAAIGIRYPLRMLPVLLFELVWKAIWLIAYGLPHKLAGTLSGGMAASWVDCIVGVILCLIVMPWPYVFENYVRRPGDPWRRRQPVPAPGTT